MSSMLRAGGHRTVATATATTSTPAATLPSFASSSASPTAASLLPRTHHAAALQSTRLMHQRVGGSMWSRAQLATGRSSPCASLHSRTAAAAAARSVSAAALTTSTRSFSTSALSPPPTPTPLPHTSPTFSSLRVPSHLVHRLAEGGIHRPTLIQTATLPHLMRRPWDAVSYPDVLVQEMTGQGKTLSYLLPMLSNIDRSIARIQGIIIVPTRELAVQVSRVLHELAKPATSKTLPLAVATLVGEANPTMLSSLARCSQFNSPQALPDEHLDVMTLLIPQHHPHVIVATPGVVHDIFVQQKLSDVRALLPLTNLKYIVCDEVDQLINQPASRNVLPALINLRHQATDLELEKVVAEQRELEETKEERKRRKKMTLEEEMMLDEQQQQERELEMQQQEEQEQAQEQGQEHSEQVQEQQEQQVEPTEQQVHDVSEDDLFSAFTPESSSSPSSSTAASPFPRNQVVFVSATLTDAVHQFASRFLSPSRAFLTPESVASELERRRGIKKKLETSGALIKAVGSEHEAVKAGKEKAAATTVNQPASAASTQRLPPHIRHYYLLVNRPYDRLNSLQQLLQAIKLQFENWKKNELGIGKDAKIVRGQPSASWLAKQFGPKRAPSAGGDLQAHQGSSSLKTRYLKGGVSSLGVGARAHFMQCSLVFANDRLELSPLVNPISQQGFNLGVVSEKSSRHERRESLQLERGVEVVLATDVLARGMDLKSLTHVINWTVPSTPNLYLHRAGRVGRLGAVHAKLGTVITLVDLQNEPTALQQLSRMCSLLGPSDPQTGKKGLQLKRLYVKKGRIYEDIDPKHVITSTHVPAIADFVADKRERQERGVQGMQAEEKEKSVRIGVDHKPKNKKKVAALEEAAAKSSSPSSPTYTGADPESESVARELPALFGSEELDLHRVAQMELLQGEAPRQPKKEKNASYTKRRGVPQKI